MSNKTTRRLELVRDFISDCLYNPAYGYFSKNVQILKCSVPFAQLKDQAEYNSLLAQAYAAAAGNGNGNGAAESRVIGHDQNSLFYRLNPQQRHQFAPLWHTPSELFQPFYGETIANFLKKEKGKENEKEKTKSNHCQSTVNNSSNNKLLIYEIGPGNGTLAKSILDSLLPEMEVEYNLVEISGKLKSIQQETLRDYSKHTKFHNWQDGKSAEAAAAVVDERPCVILAMEVFDNLAHDLIKYRTDDGVLLEGWVGSDESAAYGSVPGKLWLEWRESNDPLIRQFVHEAEKVGWQSPSLRGKPLHRLLERIAPPGTYTNPWSTEFIPTGAFSILQRLRRQFPRHSLLASDFYKLPDTIPGHNGPVVQTRFRNQSVPCSTFMLARGLFDIFFPVNFDLIGKLHGAKERKIWSHQQFIRQFASPQAITATSTKSGYNPMLQDFENVQFYYGCNH